MSVKRRNAFMCKVHIEKVHELYWKECMYTISATFSLWDYVWCIIWWMSSDVPGPLLFKQFQVLIVAISKGRMETDNISMDRTVNHRHALYCWKALEHSYSVQHTNNIRHRNCRQLIGVTFCDNTLQAGPFPISANQQVDISVWNQNIMNRTHNK